MPEEQRPKDLQDVESAQRPGDIETLIERVKEHPLQYGLSVGFILLCAIAGVFYRIHLTYAERDAATELVRALDVEDPLERAVALEGLASSESNYSAEALYLQGESYFDAGRYDEAGVAFGRLRELHSDFEYVPDAIEGLGYIKEERGDYGGAVALYKEVREKWPDSFPGRRQPFNIGRCEQRQGNLTEAVAAFREQLEVFPESSLARRSQENLTDLRRSNPELFEIPDLAPATEGEDDELSEALDAILGDQ